MSWRELRLPVAAAAIGLVALATAACSPSSDTGGGALVITGSSTIAPLVAELAQHYEREHPGMRIDVQSGGSGRGIADVRAGLADIGMVSRALAEGEQSLRAYPIARDGVGLIVNASNPIAALSDTQVVGIYRGEIESWADLGGRDAPIVVVHKAEGRATLEVFLAHFRLDNRGVHADVIAGENEQAIKTVAGNADAIGYVSIGTAEVDIEHGVPIRLLPAGGVDASLANVRNGAWPISRPLNLVTREPAPELALAFLEYVRSPAAQDVFEAQSFVQIDGVDG